MISKRFILVPFLILALMFTSISLPMNTVQAAPLPSVKEKKNPFPSKLAKGSKVEIPQWRTAHSKHFLKDDGTFVAEVSQDSIFYQDPKTKQWKDINNTIIPSTKNGFDFKNTANRFEVLFPKLTGTKAITKFTLDNSSIEFNPVGIKSSTGVTQGNKINYSNAFNHTDIHYTVQSDTLKEDIVLNASTAATNYSYELKLNNLNYQVKKDGSIDFTFKDTSRFAFKIPKPFMYEAGDMPNISDKVTQSIRQEGDKLYLDISADSTWFQNPNRKFPVTIDPSIRTGHNFFDDTFAGDTNPDTNYAGSDHAFAGLNPTYGKTESYIRFPLPGLPDGAKVTQATVSLYNYLSKSTTSTFDVYRISNWWSESQVTWNNKPQLAQYNASVNVSAAGWQTFNLSGLVAEWYKGTVPNNGIAIIPNPDTAESAGFTSSNHTSSDYHPKIDINYEIDPEGTNDFWTYTGDGVMPYKGNLFLTSTDLVTAGLGVDAAVTRSYNSQQTTATGVFGPGWLSNLDMKVWDLYGSVAFLDATGTKHIFNRLPGGTFDPPEGIFLSLTRDDTNGLFKITTTNKTVFTFDMNTGKLTKIEDVNNQTTTFTTNPSTGDLEITDQSGRTTTVHFLANGKVDYATDPKNRKAQYTYNTSELLQDVVVSLGTESTKYSYTYYDTTNLLKTVTDPRLNKVTFAYDTLNRISSVSYDYNGSSITHNYAYDTSVSPKVTVTGMNQEQTIYYANDNGNIVQTDVKLNANDTETTKYTWDAHNHLYQIERPNNQITKIDYGNNGKPINVTYPNSTDTRMNYDTNNNLISSKDPLNNLEGSTYNLNNPTDITDATGNTYMLNYASNGNLLNMTDAMSLAENYIYNSGFEMNTTPTGWNASRTLGSGDIYEVSTTEKSGGYHSFHVQSGSSSGLSGIMMYRIPVTPYMMYSLSGDIKLAANSTTEFKVAWYNSAGVKLSENTGLSLSKAETSATGWYHKSTRVTAPVDAATAEIQIGVDGIGEAWFDNLIFEGGTGRSGQILVSNQSFDFDYDKTQLADEWYPGVVNTDILIDYSEHIDGIASEKIIGDPNNYKYVKQTLNLSGTKGIKFNLSGWSKQLNVPSTGGFWGLQLEFSNTDGTTDYKQITFDRSLSGWQQISRTLEASKDFNQISVIPTFNFMPTTASVWFDNVKINVVNVPSSTVSTYNYADNSSFEYDYDNNMWPDGWYRSSGDSNLTGQYIDLNTSNGNVYTGSHAIKMTNPTSWESATRTQEKVPFDGTTPFTAVGYIKTENVTSSAVILVHAYDANGVWKGEVASNALTGTTDWTRASVVVDASNLPQGTTQIAVGVQMRAGTGTAYFDNIKLQKGEFRYQLGYNTDGNYLTSVTNTLGNSTTFTPEASTGNVTSYTDAGNNQYSYEYNMMDQITKFTFPYQGAVGVTPVNKYFTYNYDGNGNLTSIIDPNALTWTSFQYTELNQVKKYEEKVTWGGTQYTNPVTYNYDTSGRISQVVSPTGQFAQMGYDDGGRMTDLSFSDGSTVSKSFTYGYDLNGNLKTFGTVGSQYSALYDNMNRLQKVTEPTTANYLENTYDDAGRRTQLRVNYGSINWKYDYTYDSSGRPNQFHDETRNRNSWFLFNESNHLIKSFNSNNTATYYEYDQEGHVTQVRTESGGKTVDKLRYEYYPDGNIKKIWNDIEPTSSVEYTYDSLGQLLLEHYSDGTTIEYQYDDLGNRTLMINNGVNTVYTYNAEKNRLVSVGSNNYTYDGNGNVTSDGTYTYGWGDDNKLKEVKQGSTSIASFTYNALGKRETMTAGGKTKTFHYDGDLVSYVTESSGDVYRFAYDHSGKPIFMSYQGNQYWYHYDQHGNVIRMTDVNGDDAVIYKYDAWGNFTSQDFTGTDKIGELNPFRYAGYWYDNETKKYYLKARYYDSQIGRFLSKDPITIRVADDLSLNAYAYANNNPVKYVDPSGKWVLDAFWLAVDAVSFVKDPSIAGALWIAADVVSFADATGTISSLAHASKFARGAGEAAHAAEEVLHGATETSNKGFRINLDLQLFARDKIIFPKSNKDIKKIFGISDKIFHKEVKTEILKQIKNDPVYGKEFKKMGNNPDIGVNSAGNIILKDVQTGKTLSTDWSFESFKP